MTAISLVEVLGGARSLGGRPVDLKEAVRKGLPFSALEKVARRLELEPAEQARVLAVSVRTLQRLRKQKARLDVAVSDRLMRVARLYTEAAELFDDRARAGRWMRAPNHALGGQPPLALLDTDAGVQEVEEVLNRLRYGIYA